MPPVIGYIAHTPNVEYDHNVTRPFSIFLCVYFSELTLASSEYLESCLNLVRSTIFFSYSSFTHMFFLKNVAMLYVFLKYFAGN